MRIIAAALAVLTGSAAGAAQPVPEGIHSLADRAELCGMTADTVPELEARLATRLPVLPGNERFTAYEDRQNFRVWTFTTSAHAAHPAVACRTATARPDGRTDLGMEFPVLHSENATPLSRIRGAERPNARGAGRGMMH